MDGWVHAESRDGRYNAVWTKSDGVIVYDAVSDRILFKTNIAAYKRLPPSALAITENAEYLAIGADYGTIQRCSLKERVCKDLGSPGGSVYTLALNNGGSRIAAGLDSSTAVSSIIGGGWSILPSASNVNYVSFVATKGSEAIVTASQDRLIRIWDGGEVARIKKLALSGGFVALRRIELEAKAMILPSTRRYSRYRAPTSPTL